MTYAPPAGNAVISTWEGVPITYAPPAGDVVISRWSASRFAGVVIGSDRLVRVHRLSDGVLVAEITTVDGAFDLLLPGDTTDVECYAIALDTSPTGTDVAPVAANHIFAVLVT